MKHKILIYTVLSLVTCALSAQDVAGRKVTWDYPVKTYTKEWEQLKTVQERRGICQMPADVLSSLSTEDLTDICMRYPLLIADFIGTSHDRALDSLFKNFNGVRELMKRKDAVKGLLHWYENAIQNLSFLTGDASDIEKGRLTYKIIVAELLLSHCQLSDDAQKDDYAKIVRILLNCYEKMPEYPESFGGYSFGANCYSRAKIISRIDASIYEKIPGGSNNQLFTRAEPDAQAMRVIDELSYKLIDEK
ncbi:MAG: hypothetical protein LBC19_04020 [Tannerella sp.]|jgi:hypothetical protein|nr:hypothetical protein [Tannerella sp.]